MNIFYDVEFVHGHLLLCDNLECLTGYVLIVFFVICCHCFPYFHLFVTVARFRIYIFVDVLGLFK